MTIEEIKLLMKSGDIAGAEAAAQELLGAEPDNVQAMMLYGTCHQLQGDAATLRRIRDELAPKMTTVADGETQEMWRKFDGMKRDVDRDVDAPIFVADEFSSDKRIAHLYGCVSFEEMRRLIELHKMRRKRNLLIRVVVIIVIPLLLWLAWWVGQDF